MREDTLRVKSSFVLDVLETADIGTMRPSFTANGSHSRDRVGFSYFWHSELALVGVVRDSSTTRPHM